MKYFNTYFKETNKITNFDYYDEKEIDGEMHIFTFSYTKEDILKVILNLPLDIQEKIRNIFIQIDFKNGDIMHFINYLMNGHCRILVGQQIREIENDNNRN